MCYVIHLKYKNSLAGRETLRYPLPPTMIPDSWYFFMPLYNLLPLGKGTAYNLGRTNGIWQR